MSEPAAVARGDAPHVPGLNALQAEVERSFRYLGNEPPNWVPPRPGVDRDVVVVGGGQSGVATAFALRRAGIANVEVIDAESTDRIGTWAARARMKTLRTPKTIPGPELGIPSLSFRAWFEAQHGADVYAAIGRIALSDWTAYIEWYRRMVGVVVRAETRLDAIEPAEGHLRLHLVHRGEAVIRTARKVVLAMGMVGTGEANIPADVRAALPATRYAHTDDVIDFERLRGKRVAVLGAASSAFDAAGLALETDAAEVHLFCRHADLARVEREWPLGYPGAGNNFCYLSDADRWTLGRILRARAPGPMPETVRRAAQHSNFALHLDARLDTIENRADCFVLTVGESHFEFDFLIVGAGYRIDPELQPALRLFAASVATWGDRYVPPADLRSGRDSRYPYLGPGYELQEKEPGQAQYVGNIHCFNFGAIMSFGRTVGDIASLQNGVPRLVAAISRDLFLADRSHHLARLTAPAPLELTGEEYLASIWRKSDRSFGPRPGAILNESL